MVSGYHFLPVAPASWRKTTPAAAVTSVNWRATGGGAGGATAVTCGADFVDSCDFWESLHAPASRTRPTTLPASPRTTMPLCCRAILPPPLPLPPFRQDGGLSLAWRCSRRRSARVNLLLG